MADRAAGTLQMDKENPPDANSLDEVYQSQSSQGLFLHTVPHQATLKKWKCDICGVICKEMSYLKAHKLLHESTLNHECQECGNRFIKKAALMAHMISHTEERPFCCPVEGCNKYFKTEEAVRIHGRCHAIKEVPCLFCNRRFSTVGMRNNHMKYIHPSGPKIDCPFCGKQFKNANLLRQHKARHRIERSYKCTICEKGFTTRDDLYRHEKYVHGPASYECKFEGCNKRFKDQPVLTVHLQSHAERSHTCDICGNCFVLKAHLTAHKRSHTNEMPFPCPHCDKKYRYHSGIREHLMKHHKND